MADGVSEDGLLTLHFHHIFGVQFEFCKWEKTELKNHSESEFHMDTKPYKGTETSSQMFIITAVHSFFIGSFFAFFHEWNMENSSRFTMTHCLLNKPKAKRALLHNEVIHTNTRAHLPRRILWQTVNAMHERHLFWCWNFMNREPRRGSLISCYHQLSCGQFIHLLLTRFVNKII